MVNSLRASNKNVIKNVGTGVTKEMNTQTGEKSLCKGGGFQLNAFNKMEAGANGVIHRKII